MKKEPACVAGITEESFLFRFGLPHPKLAVGASGIGMLIFRYIRKAIDAPGPLKPILVIRMFCNWRKYGRRWMANVYT